MAYQSQQNIPKNAIYAKFQMSNAEKGKVDADISKILIVNEVSAAKINIAEGEKVKSFFVLAVILKKKEFDEKTIITISKLIPQNMVLVLEYGTQAKLAVYHTKLMQTEWQEQGRLFLELKGLIWMQCGRTCSGVLRAENGRTSCRLTKTLPYGSSSKNWKKKSLAWKSWQEAKSSQRKSLNWFRRSTYSNQ